MARPVCKLFFDFLCSLLQRIRSHGHAVAKMDIRTLRATIINSVSMNHFHCWAGGSDTLLAATAYDRPLSPAIGRWCGDQISTSRIYSAWIENRLIDPGCPTNITPLAVIPSAR